MNQTPRRIPRMYFLTMQLCLQIFFPILFAYINTCRSSRPQDRWNINTRVYRSQSGCWPPILHHFYIHVCVINSSLPSCVRVTIWYLLLFQVYNPTGFNKLEKVVKYKHTDVKLTIWDTSGEDKCSTGGAGHNKVNILRLFDVCWGCWLIITQGIVSGQGS